MKKTFLYKRSYLCLLVISCLVAFGIYVYNYGFDFGLKESAKLNHTTEEQLMEAIETIKDNNETIKWNAKFVPSDESYFDDALFIGDSRTVGIQYYSGIDNADYFANVGMSIYNVWGTTVEVGEKGIQSLESLLYKYKYKKIYMMMGINELGGRLSALVKEYDEFVRTLREKQPEAIIFICANLHVSEDRSNSDNRINNENLNALNKRQRALADNKTIFYLDANEIFDDENGALNAEYTGDSTHLYASCYKNWKEWLLTKTIGKDSVKK